MRVANKAGGTEFSMRSVSSHSIAARLWSTQVVRRGIRWTYHPMILLWPGMIPVAFRELTL